MNSEFTLIDEKGTEYEVAIEPSAFPESLDEIKDLFQKELGVEIPDGYALQKKIQNGEILYQIIEAKLKTNELQNNEYDVFMCHNSDDKTEVRTIHNALVKRGLSPWLDIYELQPGKPWQRELEKQINSIKSAAVFIGSSGFGPWQNMEIESFLREFVRRDCPVIPVLLETSPKEPKLPSFLSGMTYVDFRNSEKSSLDNLIWGITGKNPNK